MQQPGSKSLRVCRVAFAGIACVSLFGVGVASARHGRPDEGVLSAHALLHPVGASEALAFIGFVDDGETLMVVGTAGGLDPNETYITLIYDRGAVPGGPDACTPTVFDPQDPGFLLDRMVIGMWEVDDLGNGFLQAVNANGGLDYVPLELFRAVSVRRIVAPPPAPNAPPVTELVACGRVATRGAK